MTTTSTNHTLTIDLDAMLLRIGGDVDTMDRIPESEIDAVCAAAGVRCTYDAADADAYRLSTDRLDRLAAIIRASDDEGTIQAEDMVGLFPGRPELHTATDVRSALAAAKATADELRALARSTDDDAVEACALHQAQTWDD